MWLLRLTTLFIALSVFGKDSGKPAVLLIDGQNKHHKWQATSEVIVATLEAEFNVTRITKSQKEWQPNDIDFTKYKVVMFNYWGEWPTELSNKFNDYMKNGGGMFTIHSSLAGFGKNKEFAKMVGLKWQGKNGGKRIYLDQNGELQVMKAGEGAKCGHSKQHVFDIKMNPKSLFAKVLEAKHAKDEMYHALRGPAENLMVDGTALSPVTKKHEPMIWTVKYGNGRSFVTALGHSAEAMKSPLFKKTLIHGTKWAANTNN